ncbi:histone acetyltransferase type B [Terfezia boudieri ATCC MYA-4762]|uniref:Histone acetyltransferase type B catalytic subunit n=1 Tax=Terfezia boudieri ATCC MYA-4762 TaxID=1051890 RepID=A0A3N4LW75_9PEZI|nr:histone acetyltransferase type B [Terfezia boudieri ATCC MYA-4762]
MASPGEEWSADANEVLEISLIVPGDEKPKEIVKFHPKFTYPIFGESETIYGYKGLKIRLQFAAHDLTPCLKVTWDKKVKAVGDVEPEDVEGKMKESLPDEYMTDTEQFDQRIQNFDYQSFTPPGQLFNTYSLDGKVYEIWQANLLNEACREILNNMQSLVLFFIEGASLLDVNDEPWANRRWDVYFLYEKTPESRYTLTGYATVYRYWHLPSSIATKGKEVTFSPEQIHSNYPDTQPDPLPCRARISQFLILPPYQGFGHGGLFYDNLISHLLSLPLVKEITVEDPSDAFEDLRNLRDLTRLRMDGTFTGLHLQALKPPANSSTPAWPYNAKRIKSKLAPKQFAQCVEMELLWKLNKNDQKAYKQYRLLVKARIYKQNKDVMAQLDRLERIDKLEETYRHVEDDYFRQLEKLETGGPVDNGSGSGSGGDRDGDEDTDDGYGERPKKRVKK